jgi:hypothetical protein
MATIGNFLLISPYYNRGGLIDKIKKSYNYIYWFTRSSVYHEMREIPVGYADGLDEPVVVLDIDAAADVVDEDAEVQGIDLLDPAASRYGDVIQICVVPNQSEDGSEKTFCVAIAGVPNEIGWSGRSLLSGLVIQTDHPRAQNLPPFYACAISRFVSIQQQLYCGPANHPRQMGVVTRYRVIRRPRRR